MYNPKNPLISVHIPKCAGSSFTEVLQQWYGKGFKQHYHNEQLGQPPKHHRLYRRNLFKTRIPNLCIHGHFNRLRGNGVEHYYPDEKQIITILRDPWELHISTYFYVLRSAKEGSTGAMRDGKTKSIVKNNWTLDDYLINLGKSYLENFLPAHINANNFKDVLEEHFMFIGISEHLDESIKMLATLLNKPAIEAPIINAAERFEKPTARQKQIFLENNQLEVDIYQYALDKFNQTRQPHHSSNLIS